MNKYHSARVRAWLTSTIMLGVTAFLILPLLILLVISFEDRQGLAADVGFIGWKNYHTLLTSDEFWRAARVTCAYAFFSVSLQLVVGMCVAMALRELQVAKTIVLTVCLLPYALPTVVGSLAWRWMLSGEYAVVNRVGRSIGILDTSYSWFSKDTAIFTLVVVSAWMFTPFVVLMFFAKLTSIPTIRYEVAAVNGLSPIGRYLRVTLPEMRSVIASVIVLRTLWMASKFDVVWLLIGREAAGESVRTLPVLAYIKGFHAGSLGYAAALSIVMLVVLLGLTLAGMKFLRSEEHR